MRRSVCCCGPIPIAVPNGDSRRARERHLAQRYLVPEPRNAIADVLRAHASAAMDVSDGLVGDLTKLCRASGVSAEIDVARVPLSPAARTARRERARLDRNRPDGRRRLRGPAHHAGAPGGSLPAAASAAGVPVAEIGTVVKGEGAPRFLDRNGKPLAFARPSFSHF